MRCRCGNDQHEFNDFVTYYKDDDVTNAVCQATAARPTGNRSR